MSPLGAIFVYLCAFLLTACGTSDTARVVAQWTYDAYGSVMSADHLHAYQRPKIGHKGLFLDRLDLVNALGPQLVPSAQSVYHNRNRAYIPQLGRFLQQDPNQSAMSLIAASPFHGRGAGAIAVAFSLDGLYGDGANLYQYLGSNPWMRSDPTGLSWDPFSIVDDYLAESAGNTAAFLGAIGHGSKAAAIVGAKIVAWLPFPGANAAGELGLVALGEQTLEQALANMATGAIAGKLIGSAAILTARIGVNAFRYAAHYAARSGIARRFIDAMPIGLIAKGAKWALRKASRLIGIGRCGCFASGTVVWTALGQVPIEDVHIGDWVYARDEDGQIVLRMVTDEFITENTAIVYLTIEHVDGEVETISTTDEHPFWVDNKAEFVSADELIPGDKLVATSGISYVRQVSLSSDRTTVYNLTVDDVHTYFVGTDGIFVHNNTPPTLPDGLIAQGEGFELRHLYKGGDHGPPHAHLFGPDGSVVRVGQNGRPLAGERELTRRERAFLQSNKSILRRTLDKVMRWYRSCRV